MITLNPLRTQKDHVYKDADGCPVCEYEHPSGDNGEFEEGYATLRMHCPNCNSLWLDVYRLEGYRLIHKGEKP